MPSLPTEELKSKVISENDVQYLATKHHQSQKVEGIPLKENNNNPDVFPVAQQKKKDGLNENKPINAEEDQSKSNSDVSSVVEQEKQEENPLSLTEENIYEWNTKNLDEFGENTPFKALQIKNSNSADLVLFIRVESEEIQVGRNNHIVFEDGKESTQSTEGHQTCLFRGHNQAEIGAETKKLPNINTYDESSGLKPYQNLNGDERCTAKSLEGTTEDSDNNLHMSSTKKIKKRRKRRVRQNKKKVPKNISPASPSAAFAQLCKISDDVMFQLQVVRDNGKWKVFEDIVVTLSHKYQSKEAEIVILLEKAIAACYQSRLEESEEMILKAIDMAKETENSSVLIGRGFHYLSGVYRRQSLTGKANECVVKAEQNFHNKSLTLDSTFLAYERASVLMDFISKCPNPGEKIINKAKACLVQCITGCIALEEDNENGRYVKKHHFAFIKRAILLLDCRTASGRKRTVSQESIKEAENSLQTLKTRYWDGIARGEKVQYFLGLADLYFRCQEYPKAEESAIEALNMAKRYGFNTEIKPAEDRLQEIRRRQRGKEVPGCHGNQGYMSETSEDGVSGDVSSSESDFMEKSSLL